MQKKKTILITGASGFIGRNLKNFFERNSDKYIVFTPTHKELNLLDAESINTFFKRNKVDIIIHAANTNTYIHRETTDYEVLFNNTRMYINLARCSNRKRKMIYFGSGAEYSKDNCGPFITETQFGSVVPLDSYGYAKYIMAELTEKYENVIELCLFGVYGYFEEANRRFISNVISQALNGNVVTINQHCYFDYLWVGDLCRIVERVMLLDMQYNRYNLCTGKHKDLYDIAQIIIDNMKKRELVDNNIFINIEIPGWKREYSGCPSRLLNEIGNYEFITVEDSINRMIDFILLQREKKSEENQCRMLLL